MEMLLSYRSDLKYVPESYILPPESRPGNDEVPLCETVPVIDLKQLGHDPAKLVQQIIEACQEFGFFLLINHGVPEQLLDNVLEVAKESFELPLNDIASIYSEDPNTNGRFYPSVDYNREATHYWRDSVSRPCHPVEEHLQSCPEKPVQYREVIGNYSVEVKRVVLYLLDLICEGLGLEAGFFGDELSKRHFMAFNHYPPCPDPSLTLGLPKHCDCNLLTILLQGQVHGLQILKDEQWLAIEPPPHALVVNISHILQVITNGKLSSADHRVVTNKMASRFTVTCSIHPSLQCHIEPSKMLVKDCSPPLYKAFIYKDFLGTYMADGLQGKPALERYKLHL
jgi:isopenicillin N synthase-like dioxygenase